ncbi:cobalt transporter CbiM [Actinomadura verrucosospora]|uniref:Cobalamin (Vitamin B12) biosynthesis protein CbiM n=1 Tax=Actinomadura verrucosospora TaxID=46165 RepID=A0A7D4ANY7_ACTVE|nr:cobalt transporter CbiM [Actinomadura verrucosospora]QKG23028.1 cobalamin (vitamin B12) biosynthesis protein CbiM [Actinomadura verrucosospora]
MHIPDGYLSPQTCAVGYAIAVPAWAVAVRRVQRVVRNRHVPTLAVLAAVSFLVMMFNIPIPDGTTAHAIGATVIAILLGPWAAVLAVSVALGFQALLFGDGGVLAFGFNCANMAVLAPFAGYGVYKLIAGRSELTAPRRALAAAAGGYAGINAAAFAAAIEFGLQPDLFHNSAGAPLYAPYHLSQTIPAMMLAHLTIAGIAEGILTGGVVAYLQRANLPLLRVNHGGVAADDEKAAVSDGKNAGKRRVRPLHVALGAVAVMVVLTPLGLLAPGGAFGEDAPEDLDLHKYGLSAVPSGLNKYNGFWHHALFNGYDFTSDSHPTVGYIVSAVVGIAIVGAAIFLITMAVRWVAGRRGASQRHETAQS